MARFMKLEVNNKEYLIGFSNRMSALKAEKQGLYNAIQNLETSPLDSYFKLLKLGLMDKQPTITNDEVNEILEGITANNDDESTEEAINFGDISKFLIEEYMAFLSTQGKKKTKKLEIVEM